MKFLRFLPVLLIISFVGCSTIFTGTYQKINVKSEPNGAQITVTDDSTSMKVFNGETPSVVRLKKGDGYFQGKSYTVSITKTGYKDISFQITPRITGWYVAGNIVVGGLIGWIIIDPLTGGMWTLKPTDINANLAKTELTDAVNNSITIVMRSDIDDKTFASMNLVKIN